MATILIIVLGLYAVLDALTIGLGAEQRPAYAAVFCITCLLLFVAKRRPPVPRTLSRATKVWSLVGMIGLVMILVQDTVYWLYVAGDAASFFYPAILLSIASRDATPFYQTRTIKLLGALLVAASLGSVIVMPAIIHSFAFERFREPPLLLMALGWLGMVRPRNVAELVISMLISVFVLQLTLMSGARFSLVLWPMMGLALFALGHVSRQMVAVSFCILVFAAVSADVAVDSLNLGSQIEGSRIGRFVERLKTGNIAGEITEDVSMNNRILEAKDVVFTRYDYQGPLQWGFGSGHGATFAGSTAEYGERLLPNGDVHHIHFGLVLMYYRYGLPGLFGFIWLLAAACRQMWSLRRLSPQSPMYYPSLLFTVAAIGYLLNSLLFNAFVDPLFAFTIAGFLTTRDLAGASARSKQRPIPRGRVSPRRGLRVSERLAHVG